MTALDYDVLGVGFGPANLALAVALDELWPEATVHFVESRPGPAWQPGMLLDRADIQHHPLRDLVTPRNPRSRYTFTNYLHEQGRMFEFLNVPLAFPLRKEYARYISWVASQFADRVAYGRRIAAIEVLPDRSGYRVRTTDGTESTARAVVLAPGRTPYVPEPFAAALGTRVFHATDYLFRLSEWDDRPLDQVAVIGGSQSAAELVLDLARRRPAVRVLNVVRGFGYRLKDTSPFMEEVYFPEFVDYYYGVSQASKDDLDQQLRPTNYSSVDGDLLHDLYVTMYEQRLDRDERIRLLTNRRTTGLTVDSDGVALDLQDCHTGVRETARADLVVLATGFRDLGSGPTQERVPPLLAPLATELRYGPHGGVHIAPDYGIESADDADRLPPLHLNGLCESTHGMGDAGSFSLLALRSARILAGLRARLGDPIPFPAGDLVSPAS